MTPPPGPGVYLVTPEGTWRVHDSDEAADVVCVLTEQHADKVDEPMQALSRQQVATQLGRGIPADFPSEDIVTGAPHQGGTRGWWESTVQRYLLTQEQRRDQGAVTTASPAGRPQGETPAPTDAHPEAPPGDAWPLKSRQWSDVDLSGVDQRVLLVTTKGLVTPSGVVKSGPLTSPARLGEVVCRRRWSTPPGGADPQLWIFPEALEAIGFQIDGQVDSELPGVVAAFFDCTVKYHKSGWFTCEFDAQIHGGETRSADIVLIPYLPLDPSPSRPMDRGVAGIQGTETELPDDEEPAAHLLGDRIAWLYGIEGALPAPRWSQVGAHIEEAKRRTAKPKPKNTKGAAPQLVPCPLPIEITSTGKMPYQWWGPEGVDTGAETEDGGVARRRGVRVKKTPHRPRGNTVDVEVDQQAAYLPSAEGLYLGYGKPDWHTPDPSVFNDPHPPFGVFQVTTPAATELCGLHRKLPLPHPAMRWDEPTTWWATTADVRQLTAAPEIGGAGISWAELQIDSAWVWPEQHQWLKGFAKELRSKRIEAVTAGREDYTEMIKAIYTSFFGRLEAVGEGSWKYPLLHLQQPAWYAAIEAVTRARAMKYAVRIANDHGLYPVGWWADAWFYRVPAKFDLSLLEDPLRDGVRTNGSYRLKNVVRH